MSVRVFITGDYADHLKNRKTGTAEEKRLLAAWAPLLDHRLDELTETDFNRVLQKRRDGGIAHGTLARDWTSFRAMLGRAVKMKLLGALPFVGRPAALGITPTARMRWLGQHDEGEAARFERALAEESTEAQAFIRLAVLTGMRRVVAFNRLTYVEPLGPIARRDRSRLLQNEGRRRPRP